METCIFCKIMIGDVPAKIVYRDEYVQAMLDIHPCASGHTLVIPTEHVETLSDVPTEKLAQLFSAVQNVISKLSRAFAPDGFTIGINHGKAGGQAVEHLHIHIIPRMTNDGGGSLHSVVQTKMQPSLDEVLKKIESVQ